MQLCLIIIKYVGYILWQLFLWWLYFMAVVFVVAIFYGNCSCGDYILWQLFLWWLYFVAVVYYDAMHQLLQKLYQSIMQLFSNFC